MAQITQLDSFKVPLGGQQIELQQIDYEGGGMSLLRIRIREGSRFTVFDIDPLTARHWAESMARWTESQAGMAGMAGPGTASPATGGAANGA